MHGLGVLTGSYRATAGVVALLALAISALARVGGCVRRA
jgi:hypothetical protein